MRQLLLVTLGSLLLGAAVIWLMQQDQGYILISLGTVSVEMSFWLGALIFFASSCFFIWLLLFFRWLLGAGGVRQWWVARRAEKQTSKAAKGLLDYLSGDWCLASRGLRQSVKDPALSRVSLLFAAKAAANNDQLDQAKQLLKHFSLEFPEYKDYADLLLAEALIQISNIDQAQEILAAVKTENKMTLRLLSDVYCMKSDWSALSALIPKIKRQSVLDEKDLKVLQVNCYRGLLVNIDNNLPTEIKGQKLEAIWSEIPRSFRQIPDILAAYSDGLAATDSSEKALSLLAKALKTNWHQCLVEAYGRLDIKDGTKQLALGEQWLVTYSQDPMLLLALGRICRRMGFLGKAKDYMKSTINLSPSAQAYHELATILELLGDTASSSDIYRQGLRFATRSKVDKI